MAGPLFDALRRELDFLKNFPDVAALNDLAIRYAPPGGAEIRRPHYVEPGRGVKGLSVVDIGYEIILGKLAFAVWSGGRHGEPSPTALPVPLGRAVQPTLRGEGLPSDLGACRHF